MDGGYLNYQPLTSTTQDFLLPSPGGNRPLEPRALEVEFFPMEEVLHEKVKIH